MVRFFVGARRPVLVVSQAKFASHRTRRNARKKSAKYFSISKNSVSGRTWKRGAKLSTTDIKLSMNFYRLDGFNHAGNIAQKAILKEVALLRWSLIAGQN